MNKDKIWEAREDFLRHYPDGFANPVMVEIGKKHRAEKMYSQARELFDKKNFMDPEAFAGEMMKFIGRASIVSVFEKARFRDFIKNCRLDDKEQLTQAYYELIHGEQEKGFILFNDLLAPYKLAKWTLLTSCAAYYYPTSQVFIKPTTVKLAIEYFEMENVAYTPKIDYGFYMDYREKFLELKALADVTEDNLALGGFIMMIGGKI